MKNKKNKENNIDIIIAETKGFDKYSFRKDKENKKHDRRKKKGN